MKVIGNNMILSTEHRNWVYREAAISAANHFLAQSGMDFLPSKSTIMIHAENKIPKNVYDSDTYDMMLTYFCESFTHLLYTLNNVEPPRKVRSFTLGKM